MHLGQETIEALQAVGGFLLAIGIPLLGAGKAIAAAKARAYAKAWLKSQGEVVPEEPVTRRLPEVAPDDATVESLRALLSRVQRDNEALRDSLREATRANDVEAQALRRQLAEAKKALADAEGKGAAQFYQLRRLESLVEVLQREVNDKRRDESAGLSTPKSDRPGVPTVPPKPR